MSEATYEQISRGLGDLCMGREIPMLVERPEHGRVGSHVTCDRPMALWVVSHGEPLLTDRYD